MIFFKGKLFYMQTKDLFWFKSINELKNYRISLYLIYITYIIY